MRQPPHSFWIVETSRHEEISNVFLGLNLGTWLGLTVVGTAISTIGSLFGIVLKDYFFTRSFERWKQQRALEQVYQRFRDPLLLAARELMSRTVQILDDFPPAYLTEKVLASSRKSQLTNSIEDPYFQRYKLISTAYRLSAFLGWLELYRQEITFLNSGDNKHANSLKSAVDYIRSDLAEGRLNEASDWHEWKDVPVFREEIRAIGESMIEMRGATRAVMGYGRYCEHLESQASCAVQRWSPVVMNFILGFQSGGKDFRQMRLKRMAVHLFALMQLLGDSSIDKDLRAAQAKLQQEIDTA